MRLLGTLCAVGAIATTPATYLQSQQQPDGGWGSPQLTAWSVLGLRAAGSDTGGAVGYLAAHESALTTPTEIALVACAEAAAGHDASALLARLPAKPSAVNDAIWQIFAVRESHRIASQSVVAYVKNAQARSGGFPWAKGTAPDSNTTAWAVQALEATGTRGRPIARALTYLRKLEASNGGFRLVAGRAPDAQSTALAIQAFVAAGVKPPAKSSTFLASLRRDPDRRRRVRARVPVAAVRPAQVLPALARKPFPLR